jgi:hypothetical protein
MYKVFQETVILNLSRNFRLLKSVFNRFKSLMLVNYLTINNTEQRERERALGGDIRAICSHYTSLRSAKTPLLVKVLQLV